MPLWRGRGPRRQVDHPGLRVKTVEERVVRLKLKRAAILDDTPGLRPVFRYEYPVVVTRSEIAMQEGDQEIGIVYIGHLNTAYITSHVA